MKKIMAITALVFSLTTLFGVAISQENAPSIPPIGKRVGWDINGVPANLVVEYKGRLHFAFPILSTQHIKIKETFVESRMGGVWLITSGCSTYLRNVKQTPTAWKKGADSDWQPYVLKTFNK